MAFNNAKEKGSRQSTSTNLPWKINWADDIGLEIPGYFAVLHDLSALWTTSDNVADNGDLMIHFVKGELKAPLCNHNYFDSGDPASHCQYCEMPGSFPGQDHNDPFCVKPLLVICCNLIGEKKTSKKDESKEFDCNPFKILELRYKKNFKAVEDYHNFGALSIYDNPKSILTVTQKADPKNKSKSKGFTEPKFLTEVELMKLGTNFKFDIQKYCPEIWERFNPAGRSKKELANLHAEIRGLIFEQCGNVKKDSKLLTEEVKVIWPKVEVVEPNEEPEAPGDTSNINVDK